MKTTGKKANMAGSSPSILGRNAGLALRAQLPGRYAEKRAAKILDCSTSLAGYLLAGQHWTINRLSQCVELFGGAFIRTVIEPIPSGDDPLDRRFDELSERLRALEAGNHGRARATASESERVVAEAARQDGSGDAEPSSRMDGSSDRSRPMAPGESCRVGKDKGSV